MPQRRRRGQRFAVSGFRRRRLDPAARLSLATSPAPRRNRANTGNCYRLSEDVSAGIDEAAVKSGADRKLVTPAEVLRVRNYQRVSWWQSLVRHRRKPDMLGGNIGISGADFEA